MTAARRRALVRLRNHCGPIIASLGVILLAVAAIAIDWRVI